MARPICLLLVDSDPDRQAIVRAAMRRRADLVLTASCEADALRCLEQSALPIDWVLIDTNMEGGEEAPALAVEIRSRNRAIGILLSVKSAFDSEFRLLVKPYAARDLWAALAT